jgi:hypothetical protein
LRWIQRPKVENGVDGAKVEKKEGLKKFFDFFASCKKKEIVIKKNTYERSVVE